MDTTTVNPKVIDMINQAQAAAMDHQVVKTSGAGKAYQSVAQSAAIAVQDATDALRNISTISSTAAGVIVAQMVAGNEANSQVLTQIQTLMTNATDDYERIGAAAIKILTAFPSG